MNVKLVPVALILFVLFFYSCKKTTTTTTTSSLSLYTIGVIDSMKGYYAGTTSGDSVYYYTDSAGVVQHTIRSFSWADSLVITSADDTASILASSRSYAITFPYYYYLTGVDSVSYLQYYTLAQGGYTPINAFFVDTANNINHIAINISYGYSKRLTSNFALYKRQ